MTLKQTPSQTVGPYFAYGLCPDQYRYEMTSLFDVSPISANTPGERITVIGQILDGDGIAIGDALVEVLQADHEGRYLTTRNAISEARMQGFCRIGTGTDPQHRFILHTIKPGKSAPDSAPHLNLIVMMRGMLLHAFTRIYFDDEAPANQGDAVLNSVPEKRRTTLLARRQPGHGPAVYHFTLHMQGEQETVFFDL